MPCVTFAAYCDDAFCGSVRFLVALASLVSTAGTAFDRLTRWFLVRFIEFSTALAIRCEITPALTALLIAPTTLLKVELMVDAVPTNPCSIPPWSTRPRFSRAASRLCASRSAFPASAAAQCEGRARGAQARRRAGDRKSTRLHSRRANTH